MAELGPDEREIFESLATPLYEETAVSGGLKDSDPRIQPGGPLHEALSLLVALNLLVHDRANHVYIPVDPSTVQSHVVGPMSQRGAELLGESSEWARAFSGLSQAWRRSPTAVRGPITEFHGRAIQTFINGAVAEAEEELLTAQPQTGRERASLKSAAERDKSAIDRGVKMRTLYQHSARRHALTREYVSEVSAHGAEVRTLDEFFNRMIVVDRRLAVIPGPGGTEVGIAVQEPALVAYLVDVFERAWERARPFTSTERSMMNDIAREQRAMTIRMLIEGHSDPVSAKRLGVSARTFAGYVADLKAEYDAETRFQLGYTMGQLGVSGREEE
ncbi:MAG TPA: LuxR family transcriptional regulator [Nocardioides sp.]|uniref:LuxR family transcriptional regulator n=1 Tax=Nocardioides sp. TaxID=35761 RepID=UPI002F3E8F49